MRFYNEPRVLLISALGFVGAIHVFNLLNRPEPVWVVSQVVRASILGLFYGYVTLKTGSLLPAMLMHYLGNLFMYPLTAYVQNSAPMPAQALYGIIFSFGVILPNDWIKHK